MPKVLLLVRITPFLDMSDIVNLSCTCVAMRRSIYSPIGWKILNQIHSPYPIIVKEIYDDASHLHLKTNYSDSEYMNLHEE